MTEKEKRMERINMKVLLNMKVLPSIKAIAEENAAPDGRTLSNYIEKLIRDDAKRRSEG